jgi:hypothetical protein
MGQADIEGLIVLALLRWGPQVIYATCRLEIAIAIPFHRQDFCFSHVLSDCSIPHEQNKHIIHFNCFDMGKCLSTTVQF